jgi:hypothetical protein
MPTFAETAGERIAALKADKSWGSKYLDGDSSARNEMKTLLALAHGNLAEADQTRLAASIKLERIPSVAAGERQREAAQTAVAALSPHYNYGTKQEFGAAGVANIDKELREWSAGLGVPSSTERTVLQRVAETGEQTRKMTPEQFTSWRETQDRMLLGAAHGDPDLVAKWKADAAKVLSKGKFNFENSGTLHDAFIIRTLALAGANRK